MGPIAIGLLTFATTMAGALLGWWIGRKADIRQHLGDVRFTPNSGHPGAGRDVR